MQQYITVIIAWQGRRRRDKYDEQKQSYRQIYLMLSKKDVFRA